LSIVSCDLSIDSASCATPRHVPPGWPSPAGRVAERPHPLGAWVCAPLPGEVPPDVPGFTPEGGAEEGNGAGDERQLARDDPLIGLLHMQARAGCVRAGCACVQVALAASMSCPLVSGASRVSSRALCSWGSHEVPVFSDSDATEATTASCSSYLTMVGMPADTATHPVPSAHG
jgi:hypothetical protein